MLTTVLGVAGILQIPQQDPSPVQCKFFLYFSVTGWCRFLNDDDFPTTSCCTFTPLRPVSLLVISSINN